MVPYRQASRRGKSQGETRASIHKVNHSVYFDDLLGMCFHESANGLRRLFEFRRRELDSECCAIRRGRLGESLEFRAGFVSRELDSIQTSLGGTAAAMWWSAGLEGHARSEVSSHPAWHGHSGPREARRVAWSRFVAMSWSDGLEHHAHSEVSMPPSHSASATMSLAGAVLNIDSTRFASSTSRSP
jgi:hypothetical protein